MSGARCRPWRWAAWTLGVLATIALAAVVAFVNLGRWLEAPAVAPAMAPAGSDVIVLLGGDNKARLATGLALYRRGAAPRIFLAGAEGDDLPGSRPLPNVRLDYRLAEGVPRDAIFLDPLSRNSWDEATMTLRLMRRNGWQRALVVSDPPHMRRLSWTWRRVFADGAPSWTLVSSEPRWWKSGQWWRDEWSGQFVITEVIKIGYYFAVR